MSLCLGDRKRADRKRTHRTRACPERTHSKKETAVGKCACLVDTHLMSKHNKNVVGQNPCSQNLRQVAFVSSLESSVVEAESLRSPRLRHTQPNFSAVITFV